MRRLSKITGAMILLLAGTAIVSAQQRTPVWSDEFDGTEGSAPDQSKWAYDLGGWGWGNNEWQTYTNRTQNAYLDGMGNLVIKAIAEPFTGSDGIFRNYTSARLVTRGKFEIKYGRIEARLKVPFGQGIWPAFWMLGNDINTVGWPNCGEIDIMENIGREPSTVHGTLHGPGYSGGSPLTGSLTLPESRRFTDDFHTFAVEWEPREIRFFIDDVMYQKKSTADLPAGARWVFDHPFYLLLNLAVGGNWPGYPDATTTFPQMLTVDYVRIYSNYRMPLIENRTQPRKVP
ncbi:MAG: glycoside hydrolase family 16 protein [Acidobacteriota bacterium]|nr:MAG: glycoside hydrolase family 16 protein [Acidobacteriota bacterium]